MPVKASFSLKKWKLTNFYSMAKISKRVLAKHNQAVEILKKDTLSFNDREFVFKHYHEGAGKMNNLISAHFTPYAIAHSMTFNIAYDNFVDLCAGIGILSYAMLRQNELTFKNKKSIGICVENCTEYYEVGKKLLPEFHWINGDIFDPKVIAEIKSIMNNNNFSIISNPPYGSQVKTNSKDLLKYTGSTFEYKAIELGAILGAFDGAFLIPQGSCPFRYTGRKTGMVYEEKYKTDDYKKFQKQTDLELIMNTGFSTDILPDEDGWKDVSTVTEIACVDYYELDYKPKMFNPKPKPVPFSPKPIPVQKNLFD